MGSDKNYLSVETTADADVADVKARLLDGDQFGAWEIEYDESLVVVGHGGETEPAVEKLRTVGDSIERALLLHVYDTVATGVGTLYETDEGELVEVETFEGGERYGTDVSDYFKREYDIHGPR